MGAGTFVNERVSPVAGRPARRTVDMPLMLTVIALIVFGLIMLY